MPRCVLFHPDGGCLYSGASDSLRVYGWEPDCCFDVVPVGWGRVADMAICNNKLVSPAPGVNPFAADAAPRNIASPAGCSVAQHCSS